MGELEKTVGYTFQDPKLLELALTHSSYAHEHYAGKRHDNERLEFLGDAVLELVSSDYLFHNYNEYPEGELTKLRASIVCEQSLAMCAEAISLGKYLRNRQLSSAVCLHIDSMSNSIFNKRLKHKV